MYFDHNFAEVDPREVAADGTNVLLGVVVATGSSIAFWTLAAVIAFYWWPA